MPSFTDCLGTAVNALSERDCWQYALVPLFAAATDLRAISRTLAADTDGGVTFVLPGAITDGWSLVSLSGSKGVVATDPTLGVPAVTIGILLYTVLLAGYLAGLRDRFRGATPAFRDSVRRLFVPFLGLGLVRVALIAPVLLGVALSSVFSPVILLAAVVTLLASYLLYPVPYLLVLGAGSLREALRAGASLATDDAGVQYAAGYALTTGILSFVATAVVVNTGPFGVFVAVVGLAPMGLALDSATLWFVAAESEVAFDDGSADGDGTVGDGGADEASWGDEEWGSASGN